MQLALTLTYLLPEYFQFNLFAGGSKLMQKQFKKNKFEMLLS